MAGINYIIIRCSIKQLDETVVSEFYAPTNALLYTIKY